MSGVLDGFAETGAIEIWLNGPLQGQDQAVRGDRMVENLSAAPLLETHSSMQ